ncbi:hypothetical protein A6E92_31740 (plasmid) [Streptomyces sp. S8]|nr:hypothetical protein A6E92_31740 [Streptomyces sp. S8]
MTAPWWASTADQYVPRDLMTEEGDDVGMDERRGALRALRALMWVVIAVEVPVYLVWLVQVGYQAGQQLPRGDVARWAPPVLLPPAAVLFCVAAGWVWWGVVVAGTRSPLRDRWILASLVFVAASGDAPVVRRPRPARRNCGTGRATRWWNSAEVHGHCDEEGRHGGDPRPDRALNAVTYEDYQQSKKKLAEEKAAAGRPGDSSAGARTGARVTERRCWPV